MKQKILENIIVMTTCYNLEDLDHVCVCAHMCDIAIQVSRPPHINNISQEHHIPKM